MCQQVTFFVSFERIIFISIDVIIMVVYLGSWAVIAPIINVTFPIDNCLFLLEAIGANDYSTFPF